MGGTSALCTTVYGTSLNRCPRCPPCFRLFSFPGHTTSLLWAGRVSPVCCCRPPNWPTEGKRGRGERPAQAHTQGRRDAIGGEEAIEERLTNGIVPFIYREESLLGRREEKRREETFAAAQKEKEGRGRRRRGRREREEKTASLASPAKATLAPTPQHKVHPRPGPQQPETHVSTTKGPPGPSAPPSGSARARRRPFCVVLFWCGGVDSSRLCVPGGRAGGQKRKAPLGPRATPRPEGPQSWSPGPPARALVLPNGPPGRQGSVFVRYASV